MTTTTTRRRTKQKPELKTNKTREHQKQTNKTTRKREKSEGMHSHHRISLFRYMKDHSGVKIICSFSQDSLLIIVDDGDDVIDFPTSATLTEYG